MEERHTGGAAQTMKQGDGHAVKVARRLGHIGLMHHATP